jgi:hypothetical protein
MPPSGSYAPPGQNCIIHFLFLWRGPTSVTMSEACDPRKGQPDTKSKPVAHGKAVGVNTLMSGSKVLTPRKELQDKNWTCQWVARHILIPLPLSGVWSH